MSIWIKNKGYLADIPKIMGCRYLGPGCRLIQAITLMPSLTHSLWLFGSPSLISWLFLRASVMATYSHERIHPHYYNNNAWLEKNQEGEKEK